VSIQLLSQKNLHLLSAAPLKQVNDLHYLDQTAISKNKHAS